MTDREKVIRGLECCLSAWRKCDKCPYKPPRCEDLRRDALELLTETEPRLVREEDFHRADADGDGIPCWKETKSPTRRNGWAVIVYGKWLADAGVARYWTGKPTEEQMAEVKWE